jgi:hypothetical protein
MPRLDREEVIIMEFAIPQATLMRANMKNTVLIAPPAIAGDARKYQLRIDV